MSISPDRTGPIAGATEITIVMLPMVLPRDSAGTSVISKFTGTSTRMRGAATSAEAERPDRDAPPAVDEVVRAEPGEVGPRALADLQQAGDPVGEIEDDPRILMERIDRIVTRDDTADAALSTRTM